MALNQPPMESKLNASETCREFLLAGMRLYRDSMAGVR